MSSFLGGGGGSGGLTPAIGFLNFYVATTGSDSNPGTISSPFATIQHAVDVAVTFDYQDTFWPTIHVADGTYNVSTNHATAALLPTVKQLDNPQLIGNIATPANVILTNTGSDTLIAVGIGSTWLVDGFRLDAQGFTPAISCGGGNIEFDDLEFANSVGDGVFTCMACTNFGTMVWNGNYMAVVAPAANRFANINVYGSIDLSFALAFNFPVALHFGQQFVAVQQYSTFRFRSISFTNFAGVTGNRIFGVQGAILLTDNGLVTDIPGSATGKIDATVEWTSDGTNFASFFNNSKAGFPTTSNASPGFYGVYKDTTDGPRLLSINDGGVVYSVQIGVNINVQTASYTLQLFDQGGIVEMNVAGANTLTVPLNASVAFPIGTQVMVTQAGAGATTVAGAGGVTVHNAGTLSAQWAVTRLYKRATDEWVMGL